MSKSVNLPVLRRELSIAPAGEGLPDNVFVAVYTTGAAVRRYDWDEGPYEEVLSLERGHIRTERLDAGIVPILLDHNPTVRNQVGVIERHWVEDGKGYIQFRMETGTEQAEAILNKVRQGIIKTMSVGYRVWKFLKSTSQGRLPTLRAIDWEPFEVSFVSVPADAGAVIRSEGETVACVLESEPETISRSAEMPAPVVEDNAAAEAATRAAEIQAATDTAVRSALEAERTRTSGIAEIVRKASLGTDLAETMVREGKTLDQAREIVLERLSAAQPETRSSVGHSYDAPDVVRAAIVNAFAHQMDPGVKLEGKATEFRGSTMLESYAELLASRGERVRYNKEALATRALQGNSDFPVMLSEAAHQVMLADYRKALPTYKRIARQRNFMDFRDHHVLRAGEFPALKPLSEHGEIQRGSLGDLAAEAIRLKTKGVIIGVTRQLLINDSIGAIGDIVNKRGTRIAAEENAAAWAVLKANAAMSDGIPLFHADHENLHPSVVATPDIDALSAGREALGSRFADGIPLNFEAKYFIVPKSLQTVAEKLMASITATKTSDVNVFSGKLEILTDAALNDHSAWYLATDPSDAEVLVYGYLNGAEGPSFQTREGWNTDGAEMRLIHDFAVGPTGDKGIYKFKRAA